MRRFLIRSMHILVPMALLLGAATLRWYEPSWLTDYQVKWFDFLNVENPRPYDPNSGVRIVDIDDDSLEKLGQWPWPRTRIAKLIYRLRQAGAAVVAFDIVFAEPDRTSPKNIVENWQDTPELSALRKQALSLPDHDTVFAQFIKGLGQIVTGFVLTTGKAPRQPVQRGNFAFSGDDPTQFVPRLTGAVANLQEFEKAAAGNGFFNVLPEGDGLIRRVNLVAGFQLPPKAGGGVRLYPLVSVEALRVAQGAKTMIIKSSGASGELSFGQKTGIVDVKIGRIVVPTDKEGRVWVHYSGHQPKRFIPAWKILDGSFDKSLIKDHIVLVGASAAGLLDLRSTPLDQVLPGVEVHSELIEQILAGDFLKRPDWAFGAEMAYLIGIGLILIFLLPRVGAVWSAVIGATSVMAVFWGSWSAYTDLKMLLDPVYPSLAALGIYLSASLISYIRTEGERRQVRGAFAQYLSPALVEQLADHPERLQLGGETKEMTFLFCDVRGFTAISETFKSNPQGLTVLINRLLTPLTDAILSRQGTIDKYMGDCIMAFWNAPLDDSDHAVNSCRAALAMFEALDKLNEERRREAEATGEKFLPLNVGAGINTGECVVGNMGSMQRFDYSVLGDPVNLAARLESQSKNYGVQIVLGPKTGSEAAKSGFATLELDLIQVKGQSVGVEIHCLLGGVEFAENPDFCALQTQHKEFLAHYRGQRWDDADAVMAACRHMARTMGLELDELYDLYVERITEYRDNPPPPDWDGVFVATTK